MSNNSNKKRTCPVCHKRETDREINDCRAARAWARANIRQRESVQPGFNKYDAWDVSRPRGANGYETY